MPPPDLLRNKIREYYEALIYANEPLYGDLAGCIFVGELPIKWFRNGEPGNPEDGEYGAWGDINPGIDVEFPMDLFFMDMDGTWVDESGDGVLDGYSGSIQPEIWAGRITAVSLLNDLALGADNEKLILEDYFNKNIYVRENEPDNRNKALILENIDTSDKSWINDLDNFYSAENVFKVSPANLNTAVKFMSNLISHKEINKISLVHIKATGSAYDHSLQAPNAAESTKCIRSSQLHAKYIQPPFFYLATAGSARYTENNFIGGSYIFTSNRNRVPDILSEADFNTITARLVINSPDYDYFVNYAYNWVFDGNYYLDESVYNSAVEMIKVARILIKTGFMQYSGGLTLVGSTKSYCMEDPAEFYHGLTYSYSFGKSLKNALCSYIRPGAITPDTVRMYFGMTIIGDPTTGLFDKSEMAIEKGINWILSGPLKNGKGGTLLPKSQANSAISAMTALVLLNRNIHNQVVEEALTYLTTPYDPTNPAAGCLRESGEEAWIVRFNGAETYSVYSTSLAVLALAAIHPDPASTSQVERDRFEILRKMNNFLINCQTTAAGSTFYGGFRYSKAFVNSSADNSNTQFALMAIYVASMELLPIGVEKHWGNLPLYVLAVFDRAKVWLDVTRSTGANSGHQYVPGSSNWNKTMSAAAAWGYMLSGSPYMADSDFNYLAALPDPYGFSGLSDPGYYAWTLAVACALSRSEAPLPGKGDWYAQLSAALISLQLETGEWPDLSYLSGEEAISLTTLFALLALETKTLTPDTDAYKVFIFSGSGTGYK